MGRIKILKENKKSKFMIIMLIIFCVIYALFGVMMMISPALKGNRPGLQFVGFSYLWNIYSNKGYVSLGEKSSSFLHFVWKNPETGKFVFLPSNWILFFIPLIVGGSVAGLLILRLIIHAVGYQNKTKNGVARIVRPIRSYQLTMVIAWVGFGLLFFCSTISFLAACPFQMGVVWEFSLKGIPAASDQDTLEKIQDRLMANGNIKQFYWPTLAWFFDGYVMTAEENVAMKWLWIFVPTVIFIPFLALAFAGTIAGECAWWRINLAVLRDIDASTGTNLSTEYDHVKKPKTKKEKYIKEKSNREKPTKEKRIKEKRIKEKPSRAQVSNFDDSRTMSMGANVGDSAKCIAFYKSIVRMLELSKNTQIDLYDQAKDELNRITNKKAKIDWEDVGSDIEEIIEDFTGVDQRFVSLIENVMDNSKVNVFGRYLSDLEELTEEYWDAIDAWDILEAESVVEQIFAIAFRREELMAKVGYCLRERLESNFKHIDDEANVVKRLDKAKRSEDYDKYRETCLEAIEMMSPIKSKFSNYASKIIYN
ncbi:hypothetical protein SCHIN_v1c06890 [Spiroplasma chinense]|uniref:Transmembrane protein n=1 Tax=Spiroplasma chinense TaxID=216932 RepID=A0A5B9Y5A0_9MOLU|nr:hypothetical protein [Spiroplasma chinense]QEH61886.1 hypothetical protein SCHIN_v1c06890 [Spiroplasma chinense]